MSLSGKVAVVFGASGYVGSGATDAFLNAGATVVAVGRDLKKLEELKGKVKNAAHLHLLAGDYANEEATQKLADNLKSLLAGKDIDRTWRAQCNFHILTSKITALLVSLVPRVISYQLVVFHVDVVVAVGFVYKPPGAITASSLKDLDASLHEGLPQLFLLARQFVPGLKSRAGASFTHVSGGFAYACPEPHFWPATVKNAALNAVTLGLASETKEDKVRVNNLCIGVGVAPLGGDKNQWGWPGVATAEIGKLFVSLAIGHKKGEIVNVQKPEQVAELEKSLAQ